VAWWVQTQCRAWSYAADVGTVAYPGLLEAWTSFWAKSLESPSAA
jgi:hypothetical protein